MTLTRISLIVLVALTIACGTPTRPTASVVAARPLAPAGDAQISFYQQPITLTVHDGTATRGATPASRVEVARDDGFSTSVGTKPLVRRGDGTSQATLERLTPGTYFWRVETTSGDGATVRTLPTKFTIGPELVIRGPAVLQPALHSFTHRRPTLSVVNAATTGPSARLTYAFDVSADAAFTSLVTSGTVAETPGQTSFVPPNDLTAGLTYFWRVRARDAETSVMSDYMVADFTTVLPDDGDYRYDLIVTPPTHCAFIVPTGPGDEFHFDDKLTVRGDVLLFALPRRYSDGIGFELRVSRSGSQVSGVIGGNTTLRTGFGFVVGSQTPPGSWGDPVATAGTADNAGNLTGTFDGNVELPNCCFAVGCMAKGYRWTLKPHR